MTFDTTTPEGVNAPVTKKPVTGYVFPFFHPSAKDSAVCTPPVAPAIWTLPHKTPAIRAQTGHREAARLEGIRGRLQRPVAHLQDADDASEAVGAGGGTLLPAKTGA